MMKPTFNALTFGSNGSACGNAANCDVNGRNGSAFTSRSSLSLLRSFLIHRKHIEVALLLLSKHVESTQKVSSRPFLFGALPRRCSLHHTTSFDSHFLQSIELFQFKMSSPNSPKEGRRASTTQVDESSSHQSSVAQLTDAVRRSSLTAINEVSSAIARPVGKALEALSERFAGHKSKTEKPEMDKAGLMDTEKGGEGTQ